MMDKKELANVGAEIHDKYDGYESNVTVGDMIALMQKLPADTLFTVVKHRETYSSYLSLCYIDKNGDVFDPKDDEIDESMELALTINPD